MRWRLVYELDLCNIVMFDVFICVYAFANSHRYRDRKEGRLEMHMIYYVMLITLFDDLTHYTKSNDDRWTFHIIEISKQCQV